MDLSRRRVGAARAVVIGWREPVALTAWGIRALKTKVDTGARTSALHVSRIEPRADGRVRFDVVISTRLVDGKRRVRRVPVESEIVRTATVRSSTGRRQTRVVVRTPARIAGVEREIELTLVCRKRMRCRLLLGRSALRGFTVDPNRARVLNGRGRNEGAGA